jgi:nicotinamidase-related amidase
MPAPKLEDLVAPEYTAIVTQECQEGVLGADSALPELAAAARREAIPNLARLLPVARAAGVQVVHCVVQFRADRRGANHNARLFAAVGARRSPDMTASGRAAEVLPELAPEPSDLVLSRIHGIGPMGGTDLDAVLRNLGVKTIVATGVSVNVAITNLVMDAINSAYNVVLPRDGVAGIPKEYADLLIDNTLRLLATVTTTDELLEVWKS